jgi:hypothetical protein
MVMTIDTTTKATKTQDLTDNTATPADNAKSVYTLTSWSNDGRYITFIQNNQVHYYDLKKGTATLDAATDLGLSNVAGWVTEAP